MTKRTYSDDDLREAAKVVTSIAGMIRYLGIPQAGGTHQHISRRIKAAGIDTSHFTGRAWNKGSTIPKLRKTPEATLVLRPAGSSKEKTPLLRRALLEVGVEHKCKSCSLSGTWQGETLTLEIDHINCNFLDNRIENLQFLCPNCHSQKTIRDIQARKGH
jgi:5-methylcytosine-specific restriction endonuclease McrA